MRKSFFAALALVMFFCSSASSEEKDSIPKFTLYAHPFSLIGSAVVSAVYQDFSLYLLFTGEIPLGEHFSVVAIPSVLKLETNLFDELSLFSSGGALGIRYFPFGGAKGFYFQLMPGMYYLKNKSSVDWGFRKWDYSGYYADFLGYVGYLARFSKLCYYVNAGLGGRYSKLSGVRSVAGEVSDYKENGIKPAFDVSAGIRLLAF